MARRLPQAWPQPAAAGATPMAQPLQPTSPYRRAQVRYRTSCPLESRMKIAVTADMYIKLHKKPEEPVTLDVIRAGKRTQMPLKTFRMGFRK